MSRPALISRANTSSPTRGRANFTPRFRKRSMLWTTGASTWLSLVPLRIKRTFLKSRIIINDSDRRYHPGDLRDGAGFLVLERTADNAARNGPIRGRLQSFRTSYLVHDPYASELDAAERFDGCLAPEGYFGAASLQRWPWRVLCRGSRSPRIARAGWHFGRQHLGHEMRHQVVITGMGVVCPIGLTVGDFAQNLRRGVSGIGPISVFDASTMPSRIAGEVPWVGPIARDRKQTFALEAARQAMTEAMTCGSRPAGVGTLSIGIGLELFSLHDMADLRAERGPLSEDSDTRLTFSANTIRSLCPFHRASV